MLHQAEVFPTLGQTGSASRAVLRYGLAALLVVSALNAFGGGMYGLLGAEGVPVELLAGSPFTSYFWPSFVLFVVVGGSGLLGAIALFAGARQGPAFAAAAGAILVGWIVAQVAIIGLSSWLQPTFLVVGVLELGLAGLVGRAQDATRTQRILNS